MKISQETIHNFIKSTPECNREFKKQNKLLLSQKNIHDRVQVEEMFDKNEYFKSDSKGQYLRSKIFFVMKLDWSLP